MICLLRNTNSHFRLLTPMQNFARFSGLYENDEKKNRFFLIVHKVLFKKFLLTKNCVCSKYWEFISIIDTPTGLKANCNSTFKTIQETLNSWKSRGLTLIEKILIVKSFIISTFLSKVALISVPEDQVKEINKLFCYFIWRRNDKIK